MGMKDVLSNIVHEHYRHRLENSLHSEKRLETLYSSRFWTAPDTQKLEEFCYSAAHLLKAPHSHIALLLPDRQYVISASSDMVNGAPDTLDFSICQHTLGADQPLAINNTHETPVVCNLRVINEYGIQAYLGVPLIALNGEILGAFCVMDNVERTWTDLDVTVMVNLASALVRIHESGALAQPYA